MSITPFTRPAPSTEPPQTSGSLGRRPQRSTGLVGALNTDWCRLVHDTTASAHLTGWRRATPALAPFSNLDDVVTAASRPGDDDVLRALLVLAHGGDEFAARTALQAVLGAVVRLARRTRAHVGGDAQESEARAVAAAWQVVRRYPLERVCRPIDGISLDVLAELTAGGRRGLVEVPSGLPADLGSSLEAACSVEGNEVGELRDAFRTLVRIGPGRCADEELVLLLAWGVRSAVISRAEAQLLLRLHSPQDRDRPLTWRDVAQDLGLGHDAVRQRASRAARRLAAAVRSLVEGTHVRQGQGDAEDSATRRNAA